MSGSGVVVMMVLLGRVDYRLADVDEQLQFCASGWKDYVAEEIRNELE